jgi:hypothetical protein
MTSFDVVYELAMTTGARVYTSLFKPDHKLIRKAAPSERKLITSSETGAPS